jgi:enoyl-CoA hydratase/carnithine racemase
VTGFEALAQDLAELGATGLSVSDLDRPYTAPSGSVRVGVGRGASSAAGDIEAFDIVLTDAPSPAAEWVSVPDLDAAVARLAACVESQPVASAVAAQVLRMTLRLSFDDSMALESLAYSMLLASERFRAWRAATPPRGRPEPPSPRVALAVTDAGIDIRLTRPARRNAFDAAMRDALVEALEFALAHPDAPRVTLAGEGPSFSAGGDLDEFGAAPDVGWAHLVRTAHSPARLAHALGTRLTARLHGACVGAGIEVPAAAARVTARAGAFFRLPEVSMGLIPGAGGTATIPRRIGRHRACWMAICGEDVSVETALAWGLIDAIEPAP